MKPREPRRQVIIPARMRLEGAWGDVCIRNISSRGMLLQAANPPPRGTYVEVFKGKHVIIGRVMWQKERRFGVQTRERIEVTSFVDDSAIATSGPGGAPLERRQDRQRIAADAARRLDRSRRLSSAFQFGCIVACSLAAAVITLDTVRDTLSRPLSAVSERLDKIK